MIERLRLFKIEDKMREYMTDIRRQILTRYEWSGMPDQLYLEKLLVDNGVITKKDLEKLSLDDMTESEVRYD